MTDPGDIREFRNIRALVKSGLLYSNLPDSEIRDILHEISELSVKSDDRISRGLSLDDVIADMEALKNRIM